MHCAGGGDGISQSGKTVWHWPFGSQKALAQAELPSGHCLQTTIAAQSESLLQTGAGGGAHDGHFTSQVPLSQTAMPHDCVPSGQSLHISGTAQSQSDLHCGGGGQVGISTWHLPPIQTATGQVLVPSAHLAHGAKVFGCGQSLSAWHSVLQPPEPPMAPPEPAPKPLVPAELRESLPLPIPEEVQAASAKTKNHLAVRMMRSPERVHPSSDGMPQNLSPHLH
jgi:hypothetical protein